MHLCRGLNEEIGRSEPFFNINLFFSSSTMHIYITYIYTYIHIYSTYFYSMVKPGDTAAETVTNNLMAIKRKVQFKQHVKCVQQNVWATFCEGKNRPKNMQIGLGLSRNRSVLNRDALSSLVVVDILPFWLGVKAKYCWASQASLRMWVVWDMMCAEPVGIRKIDGRLWLKSFDPEKHPENGREA